jgi:hypothetical protein
MNKTMKKNARDLKYIGFYGFVLNKYGLNLNWLL